MNRKMVGEILSIGDEITGGQLLDTNAQWLSQRLSELGVDVRFHTTFGDQLADYIEALSVASGRADIIVSTGGLGPTDDDLTTEALAKWAGVDLEFDDRCWAHIEEIFARRHRPIAANNRKQAYVPRGSRAIANRNGTAPGIDWSVSVAEGRTVRIFAFPGVPAELREMWPHAADAIRSLTGGQVRQQFALHCFGVGESDVQAMLPAELTRRDRDPIVGITASQSIISLRIATSGPSPEECRAKMQPTIDQVRSILGSLIFGEQDDSLGLVTGRLLQQSGRTLAIADMGLDGRVYQSLREEHSISQRLLGWQFDRQTAGRIIGSIDWRNLEQALVIAASWARTQAKSDLALAIGPVPPVSHPRQYFQAYLASSQSGQAVELLCAGHPAIRLARATNQVLNFLRLEGLSAVAPSSDT
jgi:nicotinamide-nucleotide amidase